LPRAGEKIEFVLVRAEVQRWAQGDGCDQGHGQKVAFGQHAVQVLKIHGHERKGGARPGEMKEAGLKIVHDPVGAAGALVIPAAQALGRIISSRTLSAMQKDVTQHMYGGDITRKMKLREKQKKGKKKSKHVEVVYDPDRDLTVVTKKHKRGDEGWDWDN